MKGAGGAIKRNGGGAARGGLGGRVRGRVGGGGRERESKGFLLTLRQVHADQSGGARKLQKWFTEN